MTKRSDKRTTIQPERELDVLRVRLAEVEEALRSIRAIQEATVGELEEESAKRKLAEAELYRQQQLINELRERDRVMQSTISSAVIITDKQSNVTFMNPAAERLTGWLQQEGQGQPLDTICQMRNAQTRLPFESFLRTGWLDKQAAENTKQLVLLARDGREISVDLRSALINGDDAQLIGAVLVIDDITLLRQAEQQLAEANARDNQERRRLESLLDALPVGVMMADDRGAVITTNAKFAEIWGGFLLTDGIEGYRQYRAWWPESGRPVEPEEWAMAQAILQGKTVVGQIIEIEGFDGQRRTVHNSAAPIKNDQGQVIGGVVAIQDITPLRQAEQTIREQLAEIEAIYNHAPIGLAVVDRELRFVRLNDTLAAMNGLPVAQHLGRTLREIIPSMADAVEPRLRHALNTDQPVIAIEHQGETAAQAGVTRDWEARWQIIKTPDGQLVGLSGVVLEVTERKREERYTQLLYELTAAVSSAVTLDAVLQAISEHVSAVLDGNFPLIGLLTPDKTYLDLVNVPDRLTEVHDRYARRPVDEPLPMADVARTGRMLWFENRAAYVAQYPTLTSQLQQTGVEAVIMLPLLVNDQTIGVRLNR